MGLPGGREHTRGSDGYSWYALVMQTPPKAPPRLRFISLFVPNLEAAASIYATLLQVEPSECVPGVPTAHPFSAHPPVVFVLGEVALALYQCDGRTTHAGDVGLGLELCPKEFSERAKGVGGRTFWGPKRLPNSEAEMCVTLLPDRHFFEVVEPATPPTSP